MRKPPLALIAALAASPVAAGLWWISGSLVAGLVAEVIGVAGGALAATRRPRRRPPLAVLSGSVEVSFDLRGPKVGILGVGNTGTTPVVVAGLGRSRAAGLLLEIVQDGKRKALTPPDSGGAALETTIGPGAQVEIEIDLSALVGGLPRGPYALKVRYDPRPFATCPAHWRPESALDLGNFALIVPPWPSLDDLM